jgi:prepilin signal peptidase PulO-like enzyme (type II secretory pathway)
MIVLINIFLLFLLVISGLSAGSFVNALVWRVHQQEIGDKSGNLSIIKGHSMCPNCRHKLAAKDLVPVFSWLELRGRCRYCRQPISWQYPVVELVMAAVFVLSHIFWPVGFGEAGQWLLRGGWFVAAVGLLALAVYDFHWLELPNRILYPTLAAAVIARLGYILFFAASPGHDFYQWLLSLAVASGVFLVLFILSQGRWIGYGDVRLGLVTGTILATPAKSFLMIFLASVLGTLFVLPALVSRRKSAGSHLPYGPFLIVATFIVLLFGDSIINWYKIHLL